MMEKEKPQPRKFLLTENEIQKYIDSIENDKIGYLVQLLGPDGLLEYSDYAALFYDPLGRGVILAANSSVGTKDVEVFNMVKELKSPEELDFSLFDDINFGKEVRSKLMLGCVFSNVPIAMIAFGESVETKERSAMLYVMGDNHPEEIYSIIWNTADVFTKQKGSSYFYPNNGQFN